MEVMMSKLAKTLSKEIDKGTKKLDTNVSKAVGMPEGTKVGHAMNADSAKHKVSDQQDQSVNPTGETSEVSDNA
jgi:hypothetical protein